MGASSAARTHARTGWRSVTDRERGHHNGTDTTSAGTESGAAPAPVAQGEYRTAIVHDGLALSAGMTPRTGATLRLRGRVGDDLDVPRGRQAAGWAATNALRAITDAVGGADKIERCLRMTVFVACTDDFTDHSAVADGASEALRDTLGPRGVVVRSAVGVRSLPSGAPVEVELTAAVRRDGDPGPA